MNVLVIKTSSLGDVIHMLPAVTEAARARPGLGIDWLVEESFAAIPRWHPTVGAVRVIAMRRWKREWRQRQSWREFSAARALLRSRRYELVIDSQGLLKSALWCRLARGHGVGYDRASARESLAALCYDRTFAVPRNLHAVDRNRRLMALALGYSAGTGAPDYGLGALAQRLPPLGFDLPAGSIVGLHGSSRADKLWPVAHWQALARALAPARQHLVLPWGNDEERGRAEEIARQADNVRVLPRLGLDALAVLIGQARAVVGVDTGLLHLAAALGKPGLALYTATQPALTGALSDCSASVPLRNLSAPRELTAPSVIDALQGLLRRD